MGASISTNITKLVTDAVTRTSNEIIQKEEVHNNQSVIIRVSDTGGDVNIIGNVFNQTATVDMKALSDVLNNSDNSIKLDQQIAQMAKAVISGLNLAQLADANNTVDDLVRTCIEVKNITTQQCLAGITQNISIIVERTKGNVNINKIITNQVSNSIQSCVQKAVAQSTSVQNVSAKISQAATSEAKGLSLAMIALIIVAMGLTGVGGVYAGGKIIFPAVLIASIISFVLYFQWTTKEISSFGFVANTISESADCSITKDSGETDTIGSAKAASEKCQNNGECSAYEWTPANGGTAVYYKNNISASCKSYYSDGGHKDHSPIIKKLVFLKGARPPGPSDNANAWLDTTDGSFWVNSDPSVLKYMNRVPLQIRMTYASGGVYANSAVPQYAGVSGEGWNKMLSSFGKVAGRNIDWGEGPPSAVSNAAIGDVWVDYKNPSLLKVYRFVLIQGTSNGWVQDAAAIAGIGPIINSNVESSKSVGFAVDTKKQYLLYIGIGLLLVGVLGLAFTSGFFTKKEKKE